VWGRVLSHPRVIELAPYDSMWPAEFERLGAALYDALSGVGVTIEHVGSTAVPGLLAKPILDIDVVYPTAVDFDVVRSRLESLDYEHQGDLGIAGREAFRRSEDAVSGNATGRVWPAHHLYACREDSVELRRHLRFRDALRARPDLASAYAELKAHLAQSVGGDRERYTEGKSAFVEAVLRGAAP